MELHSVSFLGTFSDLGAESACDDFGFVLAAAMPLLQCLCVSIKSSVLRPLRAMESFSYSNSFFPGRYNNRIDFNLGAAFSAESSLDVV